MEEVKIEVGMYIRYIAGFHHNDSNKPVVKIGKIIRVDDYVQLDTFWPSNGVFPTEDFKKFIIGKPSFNILDVIKEGDLVTIKSKYCEGEVYVVDHEGDDVIGLDCFQDGTMFVDAGDIKEVLTKEQFETKVYSMSKGE